MRYYWPEESWRLRAANSQIRAERRRAEAAARRATRRFVACWVLYLIAVLVSPLFF